MQINLNLENPFDKARQAFKKEVPPAQSYAEHKANFEKSTLGREASKTFTPLPYETENRGLYRTAGLVSYACQIVSVGAAASFVFAFVLSRINTLPGAWYVAFCVSAATLFVIEFLLRKETPKLSRDILLHGLSPNIWRRGLFVLTLTTVGIISSYLGGFDTAAAVAENPPVFIASPTLSPSLIDTEQIQKRYAPQITDAKTAAAEYKKRRLWHNRLSIADGNKYRKLLAVAIDKETAMNTEIQAAETTNAAERRNVLLENNKRENAAILSHETAMAEYDKRVNNNGGGLAKLSIIAQFIFFCCLFYRSHYLIETVKQYTNPIIGNDPNGGKRQQTDIYDTNDFEEILSKQQNTNNEFLNRTKMRVLPGGKSAQTHLTSNAKDTTQTSKRSTQKVFIPTDLSIEHIDRQTGRVKRLNISQVRANISANKTRLRKSKESGTDKQIENIEMILHYWRGQENELMQAAAYLKSNAAVG